MNWTIDYIESGSYVRVTFDGKFSISREKDMYTELVSQPFWKPGTPILFDNMKMDLGQIDYKTMQQAAQHYKNATKLLGKGRAALVMGSTLDFGYGRQYQQLTEFNGETEMRVFPAEAEALKWLLKSG